MSSPLPGGQKRKWSRVTTHDPIFRVWRGKRTKRPRHIVIGTTPYEVKRVVTDWEAWCVPMRLKTATASAPEAPE